MGNHSFRQCPSECSNCRQLSQVNFHFINCDNECALCSSILFSVWDHAFLVQDLAGMEAGECFVVNGDLFFWYKLWLFDDTTAAQGVFLCFPLFVCAFCKLIILLCTTSLSNYFLLFHLLWFLCDSNWHVPENQTDWLYLWLLLLNYFLN